MDLTGEGIVKEMKSRESERMPMDSYFQTLHNYFYVEGANITTKKSKGSEINELLDSTSLVSGNILAAGLCNYLTPESTKWLFLRHPNKALQDDKAVQQWMNDTTDEVLLTLSRSNFYNQMPTFYKASSVYGTAGLVFEEDERDKIRFYNIPVPNLYLTEDARERPNAFWLKYEYTAEQAIDRFGSKCSDMIKEVYKSGANSDKKFEFLCYIGERQERDPEKMDALNMAVRMVWVEKQTQNIVYESGFKKMPCVAHRFYKLPFQVYGRSPAMEALPHVRLANIIQETIMRASMKQADPALAIPDDAFIGHPNFNPRQINYYQRGHLSPKDEIIPVGNFGALNIGLNELQNQREQINKIMYVDTFQAFTDLTKQMTVPEVMERTNEKLTLLGPAVGRFMNDVLQPLIEKVVVMLFEQGALPPLPDAMRADASFDVRFVGRLVQAQRQTEINNIVSALGIAGQVAQVKPEALDMLNADKIVKEVFDIQNVNPELLNSDMEVRALREARAEAQQQMENLQTAGAVAETYKAAAEGDRNAKMAE